MEENESSQRRTNPISLEELLIQIHHPTPTTTTTTTTEDDPSNQRLQNISAEESLSHIPWTIQQSVQLLSDTITTPPTTTTSTTSSGEQPVASTSSSSSSHRKFPSISYLDLRRHQNRTWADKCLRKGNDQYYVNPEQAEKFYQEGLELVPDHIELLIAQAKVWYVRRRRPTAAKRQLQEVIQLDQTHQGAKDLLRLMERHEAAQKGDGGGGVTASRPQPLPTLTSHSRASSAYQDVLMERNLAMEMTTTETIQETDDQSTSSDSSSRQRSRRHKKKDKKKKKKKSKKGHRRKTKKKDKKKKKEGRKRRRRHYSSSSPSFSPDQSTVGTSVGGSDLSDNQDDNHGEKIEKVAEPKGGRRRRRKRHDSEASSPVDDDVVAESPKMTLDKDKESYRSDQSYQRDDDDESISIDSKNSQRRDKKRKRSYQAKSKQTRKQQKSETLGSDSSLEPNP